MTGGTFDRTYLHYVNSSSSSGGITNVFDPATVSTFRLDLYPATVGRFRQFVNAWNVGWTPSAGSGKHTHLNGGQGLVDSSRTTDASVSYETGWLAAASIDIDPTDGSLACDSSYATWTSTPGTHENLPINCVNWYEAYAFCIWDGGFLPSEAEWEYAAAGGSQLLQYPWGSTDPGYQSQYAIYNCLYPSQAGSCSGVTNIAPVGTAIMGAGLWGQLDLAGEIGEWTLDWDGMYADPCSDCAALTGGATRATRGGDYATSALGLSPSSGASYGPTVRSRYNGVRCARTP